MKQTNTTTEVITDDDLFMYAMYCYRNEDGSDLTPEQAEDVVKLLKSKKQPITAPLEPLYPISGDMAVKVKGGVNKHLKNGAVVFYPAVLSSHAHLITGLS